MALDHLEILARREQLIEDINYIIESYFGDIDEIIIIEYKDEVIKQLCDAVCNQFPT